MHAHNTPSTPEAEPPVIFEVRTATLADARFASLIAETISTSAKARGTGIAGRTPEMVRGKIAQGKAVIALTADGEWAGFAYIETWEGGKFVSNSGLIVRPEFRGMGVAAAVKQAVFQLSRQLYPNAGIISITTSAAVMKLNSRLGFRPVSFAEITQDDAFWEGCRSCANHGILSAKERRVCFCTALLYDPAENENPG
ncbi:N-acetyltransferase family protein [Chitinophaga caseinilytica]|uniref:GNAT family N-acetyltransferase n=1 Tax=Chitinophaga caseinilytica TaxID=2267521 RepID=UPI003C2F587D